MKTELHHFSDASTCGCGQCSYLRLKNDKGQVHCVLVMAKARVSPMWVATIPRLELTAAVVSVSVSSLLREELGYSEVEEYFGQTLKESWGRLNYASLRTFLYEAMAVVNSRPLTVDNLNNPSSLMPLTPDHLIIMKSATALPPPSKFEKEDLYGRKRWCQVQHLTEQFWSRWKREYLHSISTRQCWHSTKRNLQIGDIVMDMEETLPRSQWRLGRVSETVTDSDGLVRRAKKLLGRRD
ncbi:hypothetical protein MHYP_G00279390 [Metynnis hypsauchen]